MLSVACRLAVTLPLGRLRAAEQRTRAAVGGQLPVELSLAVVGAATMRRLSRERRGVDEVTDVLSFGPTREPAHVPALDSGEVVICLPVARRQAQRLGHAWRDELVVLLVHGLLHVAGFDHHRSAEGGRMRRLEASILARLGETGSGLVEREASHSPSPRGGPLPPGERPLIGRTRTTLSPKRERGWG